MLIGRSFVLGTRFIGKFDFEIFPCATLAVFGAEGREDVFDRLKIIFGSSNLKINLPGFRVIHTAGLIRFCG